MRASCFRQPVSRFAAHRVDYPSCVRRDSPRRAEVVLRSCERPPALTARTISTGNLDVVADAIGGAAAQQIVQEAMAVGGHRDEIDGLLGGDLDQLGRRIAHRQARARLEPALHELVAEPSEVLAVARGSLPTRAASARRSAAPPSRRPRARAAAAPRSAAPAARCAPAPPDRRRSSRWR